MAVETISTAVLDFLRTCLSTRFQIPKNQFYFELRDDSKERSVALYSLGKVQDKYTYANQWQYRRDYQIQVVCGKSISEAHEAAEWLYEHVVVANTGLIEHNGYRFFMLPDGAAIPRYLGTLPNGCHKYAVDVLIIYFPVDNNNDNNNE